jgi:hypothetical protein
MSDTKRRYRQYVGFAVVIVAYVGGIIGWSWAALTVDSNPSASESAHVRVEPRPSLITSAGE